MTMINFGSTTCSFLTFAINYWHQSMSVILVFDRALKLSFFPQCTPIEVFYKCICNLPYLLTCWHTHKQYICFLWFSYTYIGQYLSNKNKNITQPKKEKGKNYKIEWWFQQNTIKWKKNTMVGMRRKGKHTIGGKLN
jgi:hypothetical protein